TETTGRARTDHGSKGCLLLDQMLSLHGVLRLAVAADREQQGKVVEGMTLELADNHAARAVAGGIEGRKKDAQLIGLRHRDQGLCGVHRCPVSRRGGTLLSSARSIS